MSYRHIQGTGVRVQPERDYNYVPQDFRSLTLLTMLFCGVFSPLTFMFTIPALIYATKVRMAVSLTIADLLHGNSHASVCTLQHCCGVPMLQCRKQLSYPVFYLGRGGGEAEGGLT